MKNFLSFAFLMGVLVISGCGEEKKEETVEDKTATRKEFLVKMASFTEKKCLEIKTKLSDKQKGKFSDELIKDYCDCAKTAVLNQEAQFIKTENLDSTKMKNDILACVAEVSGLSPAVVKGLQSMMSTPKTQSN